MQNGPLAVPDGRDILPTVNTLLTLPFGVKLGTQDWHPPTHTSFAPNHGKAPFTSSYTITHPSDPSRSYTTTLWPPHCIHDTPGAQLLSGLRSDLLDGVVTKGKREDVEMYSAFYDPFKLEDSGMGQRLRDEGVGKVFVVGLAGDYCVRATAIDARREGFEVVVVEEGTRCVDPEVWGRVKSELEGEGIKIVSMESDDVQQLETIGAA